MPELGRSASPPSPAPPAELAPKGPRIDALQDPLRKQPALDPATAPIDQVLDAPPAQENRDAEAKQRDLDGAVAIGRRLVAQSKTVPEVEAFFPRLMRRFGLRAAHFLNPGEPNSTLELQVNPKASIDTKSLALSNPTKSNSKLTQDVRFKTGTLGGDTVATEMEAVALGPTHPQGGPPSSGALSGIMSQLPTDPKLSGDSKFIKGHLLNDNLGGPGVAENLYPITAQANKDHEAYVESFAKERVNLKGQWVYYKVAVNETGKDLSGDEDSNYVEADLVCELQALDKDGKKTGKGLARTIQSRYGSKGKVTSQFILGDFGAGSELVEPSFDKDAVEWSTTKGDSSGPQEVDEEVRVAMRELREAAGLLSISDNDLRALLARAFDLDIDSLELRQLMDPSLDMSSEGLDEGVPQNVGSWNRSIGILNNNKTLALNGIQSICTSIKNFKPSKDLVRRSPRHSASTGMRDLIKANSYKLPKRKAKVVKNSTSLKNSKAGTLKKTGKMKKKLTPHAKTNPKVKKVKTGGKTN